jgi:hypothetical protein
MRDAMRCDAMSWGLGWAGVNVSKVLRIVRYAPPYMKYSYCILCTVQSAPYCTVLLVRGS